MYKVLTSFSLQFKIISWKITQQQVEVFSPEGENNIQIAATAEKTFVVHIVKVNVFPHQPQ